MARGAAVPSEFYIVSAFFSDYGALYYYRIVDVRADGADSVVRYVRVAPVDVFCPRTIIQATESRLRNTQPAELGNPCAVRSSEVVKALRHMKPISGFEFVSFGIVAQCGPSVTALQLPVIGEDDLKRMRPEISALWDLQSKIAGRAFGEKDIFQERAEQDDLALQRSGEALVPELISGRYDKGLKLARRGETFSDILGGYRGPMTAAQAKARYVPQVVNAEVYRFQKFVPPKYPVLAMQARVQGKVEVALTADRSTGEVRDVIVVSGNPLLAPASVEAAKQWRFDSGGDERIALVLDYSLRCQ
jgi:Gram-negative bacterial TonB protein C-terminal